MKKVISNRRAFTPIELLVVVLIIGILAAIALPQYKLAVAKTRYVQAMTLSDSFWQAAQRYHLENGTWPENIDQLDIEMPGGGRYVDIDHASIVFSWGTCVVQATSTINGYSYCSISGKGVYAYREFNSSKRYCRAHGEEGDFSHKLCKSVGGVGNGTVNQYGYANYVIP